MNVNRELFYCFRVAADLGVHRVNDGHCDAALP